MTMTSAVTEDSGVFAELTPPYSTIVVDPPWRYRAGVPVTTAKRGASASDVYSTLSNAEVAALPVGSLAAENAHLYLWATNPRLFGGDGEIGPADILAAWGFRYVTMLTWVKEGTLGMGFYFRGNTEHVLFGVRGELPIPPAGRKPNVITARKHAHSAKPQAFFDLVESVSPGPYVELFARQPRLGWDHWGYGVED